MAGNRTFLVFLLYRLTTRKTFNYCNTQFMLSGIRHFIIRHSGIRQFVIRHSGNDSTSQILSEERSQRYIEWTVWYVLVSKPLNALTTV